MNFTIELGIFLFGLLLLSLAVVLARQLFAATGALRTIGSDQSSQAAFYQGTEAAPAVLTGRSWRVRQRNSKLLSFGGNVIRRSDGGYTAAWRAELQPTLLADDARIEDFYDCLARLLAAEKRQGTIIQFRLACQPDFGRALLEQEECAGRLNEVYLPARALHENALAFYANRAGRGAFRSPQLSIWVTVPTKRATDSLENGPKALWRSLRREVARLGWQNLFSAWHNAVGIANDGITRRLRQEEVQALEEAEKVFRLIERESPVKVQRLIDGALWQAVYFGHNEAARSIPQKPISPFIDLRDYLCGETITGENWYLLHGKTPVSLVTLFTPPQPESYAGVMRALTANPALRFRHTIITEFIAYDKEKAKTKLDKRLRRVMRAGVRPSGGIQLSPEGQAAYRDLTEVRQQLTRADAALVGARLSVLVYGPPVGTQAELQAAVKQLEQDCETVVSALKSLPGADAAREEPKALRALYHKLLVGAADCAPTGREFDELADSLATLATLETGWAGTKRPHTLLETVCGRLIGLNLFQPEGVASPVGLALGQMGSGKSVLLGRFALDVLATQPQARVCAVDFGETFGPVVQVLGGRHLRFMPDEKRAINIWDYKGLSEGKPPDEQQLALVVGDLLRLARINELDSQAVIKESICETVAKTVYEYKAAQNGQGWGKVEPVHADFLATLQNYPFPEAQKKQADDLYLILSKYQGHPWLDAPTHPDYETESPFDVYELDSLDQFAPDVAASLAYRVAARVLRGLGEKVNGQYRPKLNIFDEMHKIKDKYPDILKAMLKGTRQGRKENVVTLLATHAYEDIAELHGITKNAGFKFIGKQIGNFDLLAKEANLSLAACAAVEAIRNAPGSHAQFVISLGSGADQRIEHVQVALAPVELWTFTSHPLERNARAVIAQLRPDWQLLEAILYLANHPLYARGLVYAGLTQLNEADLTADLFGPPGRPKTQETFSDNL